MLKGNRFGVDKTFSPNTSFPGGGGGGTPCNGLYRQSLPERGTFFRLEVKKGGDFTSCRLEKLSFRYLKGLSNIWNTRTTRTYLIQVIQVFKGVTEVKRVVKVTL